MINLVFVNKDFEPYRLQLNALHSIPAEGIKGKIASTGKERTDGQGKTMDYLLPDYHPTDPTKWKIPKLDNLPQNIIDDCTYEMERTEENLINGGWIE